MLNMPPYAISARGVQAQHKACLLYASKRNIKSAAYLSEVVVDLAWRNKPPISYLHLTTEEAHVPRLNQILDKVGLCGRRHALCQISEMLVSASHLQVLSMDHFGSMEHLRTATNDDTLKHVRGLILGKLKNQFSQMTKTSVQLQKGLISRELIYYLLLLVIFHDSETGFSWCRGGSRCQAEAARGIKEE